MPAAVFAATRLIVCAESAVLLFAVLPIAPATSAAGALGPGEGTAGIAGDSTRLSSESLLSKSPALLPLSVFVGVPPNRQINREARVDSVSFSTRSEYVLA